MVNTWFTSDFHLGHRNIIRYYSRPFASVEDMDAAILANLNKLVGANDVLYFPGDFCLGGSEQAHQYRDRIVCRNIHVVEGNHDAAPRDLTGAFSSSNQLVEVRVGGQRIVLCHYAMRVWHHSGAVPCIFTGIPTAILRMIRHRCPSVWGWTHMVFNRGTSTKSGPR
jgi:calcineurin-like phosphoesterase family protein